jgi:hypothetical protein
MYHLNFFLHMAEQKKRDLTLRVQKRCNFCIVTWISRRWRALVDGSGLAAVVGVFTCILELGQNGWLMEAVWLQ